MKRIAQHGGGVVSVEEVPEPVPGPGEVLIRTGASVLCGSEMGSFRGAGAADGGNGGHEAAGEVVALGADVDRRMLGRRVGVSAVVGCGHCASCLQGIYTWCAEFSGASNLHAEYSVVAARACHELPEDIDDEVGTLLTGDGFGVPFHTQQRLSDRPFERIAIFGQGPIGLGSVMLQSFLGREVVAVDLAPARLALADELGAAATVRVEDGLDIAEAVRDAFGGHRPDVCIEASGHPSGVRSAFASVAHGGRVVFNGEQGPLELSPSEDFIRRDITAMGAWFYHFREYTGMLSLLRGGLPMHRLITHSLPVDDAAEGYRLMASGESGKVALRY